MGHPFEFEIVKEYRPGQLITVNHVVYRCTTCESRAGCGICDVLNDTRDTHHSLRLCYKACKACGMFMTFKRLSK